MIDIFKILLIQASPGVIDQAPSIIRTITLPHLAESLARRTADDHVDLPQTRLSFQISR